MYLIYFLNETIAKKVSPFLILDHLITKFTRIFCCTFCLIFLPSRNILLLLQIIETIKDQFVVSGTLSLLSLHLFVPRDHVIVASP